MTTENIHAACVALVQSMLSPEQFGYAVTAEVRDAARVALGRAPVEQAQYLIAPADHDRGVTEMVAEAKPVAADIQLLKDAVTVAGRYGERDDCYSSEIDDMAQSVIERINTILAASPQQPAPAWLSIESAPKGRKVIAGYFNKLGKWRTITAKYYLAGTLQAHEDSDNCDEEGWAPEGWYEESETHESILPTDETPSHWMPLLQPPIDAAIALQAGEQS